MKYMISSNHMKPLTNNHQSTFNLQDIFVPQSVSNESFVSLQTNDAAYHFPFYLFDSLNAQQSINQSPQRLSNLNPEIVNQFAQKLGLRFTNEKEEDFLENASPVCYANSDEVSDDFKIEILPLMFAPIDILDYIYAVLHSPAYREKYKEFLKIDFPRVPYPKSQKIFWQLVKLGGELRQIHLLECPVVEKYMTQYPVDGDNVVTKIRFEYITEIIEGDTIISLDPIPGLMKGKVFINASQYFDNVPEIAWNFYIGGYQPAQKWLKDRKGRELSFDDILHYQKIIVALKETVRIMKEIDRLAIV